MKLNKNVQRSNNIVDQETKEDEDEESRDGKSINASPPFAFPLFFLFVLFLCLGINISSAKLIDDFPYFLGQLLPSYTFLFVLIVVCIVIAPQPNVHCLSSGATSTTYTSSS